MGRDERGSLKYAAALFLAAILTFSGTAGASKPLVSPLVMQKTIKVMHCETGNWRTNGPKYYGGLGWLDATWLKYRLPGFPRYASQATPEQQARAMLHFVTVALHGWWPHQTYPAYCGPGY